MNGYRRLSSDKKAYIIEAYNRGDSLGCIASNVGISRESLTDKIGLYVKKGLCIKREEKKPVVDDTETGGINCTLKVAKTCIYGCSNSTQQSDSKCNYCLCTGKPRILTSPSHKHCHEYVKIDKDHPRIFRGMED